MDFTQITIDILEVFKKAGGSWGMAIIFLTIVVRVILVPLSISQQRSMKKMQELGPKLKQIQTKYKSDPQKLQVKMMEFYKENNFNPLGGCLPLLLQMPVFILLYTTLISVPFLQVAGDSSFLFIHRLDATLQGYGGSKDDGVFNVKPKDKFITGKKIQVTVDGKELKAKIDDYRNAIKYTPEPIDPGKPIILTIALEKIDFPDHSINKDEITSATVPVVNDATKEIEHLTFKRNKKGDELSVEVKTALGKSKPNFDVILLLVLFGITMYGSQKIMTGMTSNAAMDPQQKAMQESMSKMMPFMIMAMFVIIPIPAGVLLYMVVSNIFQVGQTVAINKYLDYQSESQKTIGTAPELKLESNTETKEEVIIDIEKNEQTTIKEATPALQQSRKARKKKKRGQKPKYK